MLSKLDRGTIERLLDKEDLPAAVRRVLELRLGGAQAAAKKLNALLARAGDDDRVRGGFNTTAPPLAAGPEKAFSHRI